MPETLRTLAFLAAALVLSILAAKIEPEAATPAILSDQGESFYPKFTDPHAARIIEIVDYDETTATARPFQVEFQRGRWVLPSNNNYPVDAGDRMAKTAAALMDLRKDLVRSDSVADHAQFGVIDPLDQKAASLAGRGKRVTLRDAHKTVLADYILGKPVEGKTGFRYVRVPGEKRTYAVKTDADPSARFADWINAGLLRIATASIRRVNINSYSIDERMGSIQNMDTVTLTREGNEWKMAGVERLDTTAVNAMASTLDTLKIVDVRPKPPSLAQDLKSGTFQLSLEAAMSLRQRGYFVAPNGRLFANEGEMSVETVNGVLYSLRFGEVVTPGDSRYLFVMANFDPARASKYGGDAATGERVAREHNNRFADWYYVISGADFQKLRLKRKDVAR